MFSTKKSGSVFMDLMEAFEAKEPHQVWVSSAHFSIIKVKANLMVLALAIK